ncbi:1-hydroxycarotenoid 3,4-desaturase CrtD [Geofilum rubicundum]|uniref:Phytoene desaturase, neurosporene or lycopene producing n=1 Tax=Geofilum rubicundum JCM 15548 TaxID=1236989 RepID=A0A0E9M248_9BACT|nr:1-hydroxycarotenoid 3,4-desaturase CrtD [Geofilum rubicundum]GAO31446.1 phytoene desaturase, neurosporene or lycopene producing [Geofilum rubicundum JCM 15548]
MEKLVACVIGSGIGGLASALRLAARGYSVTVLEKSGEPGGKVAQYNEAGYRFDMGPSLFTLPYLVDELFGLFGRRRADYLKVITLPMTGNYFFSDGLNLKAWSNKEQFLNEVEKTGVNRGKMERYLAKQSFLYEHAADVFLFKSIHKLSTYTSAAGRKGMKALHRMDAFTSMHQRNVKSFGDSRLVQLFDRYATYNGSDPYRAPATLNMIAHLEHNTGAYFPEDGLFGIITAIKRLADEVGVRFYFNTEVTGLVTKGCRVTGVKTRDSVYPADLVVNNTDITLFYRDIMPNARMYRKLMKRERSSSALIFYWGVRTTSALDVHNILFSADYKAEFEGLFKTKELADDLTVYIFISKKAVAADAPDGCENWFVMVNAPENVGQDWEEEVLKARRIVLQKIKSALDFSIEPLIESERVITPQDIECRTGSVNGALYGHSSNSRLSAFKRHPNFSRQYKNLFFTGGSVHPGGGIPLCLASARIVDGLIGAGK